LFLSFPSADIEAAHFKSKYIEIYRTLQETKAELGTLVIFLDPWRERRK